jgi:Ca2+-binding EF-hand superfamily protein
MYKRRKSSEGKMAETTVKAIFNHYDKDGNGFLEPSEVLQFIRDLAPQQATNASQPEQLMHNLLRMADENGDNKISMAELTELILKVFEARDR